MTADAYDDAGYVSSSKYRSEVLFSLADRPATPSTIARDVGLEISHVSRSLGQLRERGVVDLLVEEDTKKGRVYGLTDDGEDVVDTMREMEVAP